MKKVLIYLLAVLVCMPAISSCSTKNPSDKAPDTEKETAAEVIETSDSETSSEESEQTETTRANYPDTLPQLDFNGEKMTFHVRGEDDNQKEIYMEEMIGDPVYDVVYERNRLVEDRLNVSIDIAVGGVWDQYDQTIGEIRASISAADGAYDAISGWSARIPALSLEGLFLDLNSIPHFDPEHKIRR